MPFYVEPGYVENSYTASEEQSSLADSVYVYAQLMGDPTTQIMVSWVDAIGDGEQYTLHYGTDPSNLSGSVEVQGTQVPSRPEWIYHATLDGLAPGTTYSLKLDCSRGEHTPHPVKTLPAALPASGVRFVATSDIHVPVGMKSPGGMMRLVTEQPDAVLFAGDLVSSFKESPSFENGQYWINFVRDYLSVLHSGTMIPVVNSPGNHDVGGHSTSGGGSSSWESQYFPVFFRSMLHTEPEQKPYGYIKLGDYFQVVVLDSHASPVVEVGDWLRATLDKDTPGVAIHHSPSMAADVRSGTDMALQDNVRRSWMRELIESKTACGIVGHIHYRTRTVPLGVVDQDPGTVDSFEIDDGWIIEQEGGYVEFGQGYRSGRGEDASLHWFLEESQNQDQYHTIDVLPGEIKVRTVNASGVELYATTFPVDTSALAAGLRATLSGAPANAEVYYAVFLDTDPRTFGSPLAQGTADLDGESRLTVPLQGVAAGETVYLVVTDGAGNGAHGPAQVEEV
ncbi:fibronectin type III domain-containing protein [Halorhodospira sp. 9621]|uniref:FN3 domain-containing metallophosphoesterase family protein n=1 Tax=Halorhodospira sp. 9621 TaxID=2899135 RepID=UPI001EE924F6|nr:FN3 domain-containing metallophosphoesterase family protein [Halorhodospira sp. 9621]MCG5533102.1 fibronectin type III domain-containing protein [Halorhodospira sp. 9621]